MSPVVKLLRPAEWAAFEASGEFAGSPDDLRDGFIHLSTPAQVPATRAKWFAATPGVIAITLDATRLGADLRHEPARNGDLYPHLYRPLHTADIVSVETL